MAFLKSGHIPVKSHILGILRAANMTRDIDNTSDSTHARTNPAFTLDENLAKPEDISLDQVSSEEIPGSHFVEEKGNKLATDAKNDAIDAIVAISKGINTKFSKLDTTPYINSAYDDIVEDIDVLPKRHISNVAIETETGIDIEVDSTLNAKNDDMNANNNANDPSDYPNAIWNITNAKFYSINGKAGERYTKIDPEISIDMCRGSALNTSCRSNYELRSSSNKEMRTTKRGSSRQALEAVEFTAPESCVLSQAAQELSRSQYSLVSASEVTPGALEVWRALPDEIKYDASLTQFRTLYEKEHGPSEDTPPPQAQNGSVPSKRLPMVSSAPHLNNNTATKEAKEAKSDFTIGLDLGKEEKSLHHDMKESHASTKLEAARHWVKMASLLACWLFFTLVFMMYNERETVVRHTSAAQSETKNYYLNSADLQQRVLIKLEGPFWSQQAEKSRNSSDPNLAAAQSMEVWLERWTLHHHDNRTVDPADILHVQKSEPWRILLLAEHLIDFSEGEPRSSILALAADNSSGRFPGLPSREVVRIRTDSNKTTPFTLTYTVDPLEQSTGVMYAAVLLCALYGLIIFEIINRTLAAVVTSTSALAVLSIIGERPSLPEIISWLDVETLLLLFSMMVLVAIMAETGMFDYLAVYTFKVTKGKTWPLINLLCLITAVLSTFLDNVTTVLLMTPVTIRLCEVMQLNPVPILMAMVMYSNIGGTATPVGDPPNVIIASNQDVIRSGINFTNFTLHMTLGILLVAVQTYFQLRWMYRDVNKLRLNVPKDIQELKQQITVWRRAAASLAAYSQDEELVRAALEKKVRKLTAQLQVKVKERKKRAVPQETFQATLEEMQNKYQIRDKALLYKASFAILFVVVVFFLHSIPEFQRVSLGWTALLGAILLLILADRDDLEHILNRVEWSTLLFFAALFILMEALSKLGLIQWIGGLTESLILQVDESARLAVSIVLMLWVSGVASAFVDNIPLTTMMIRVVTSLGNNPALGLPMAPLIWALSFGACLGGNGTLIGASANVVTAGVAEQHGYRFTFIEFFKVGFPLMLGHLVVATFYLMLCHCVFTWH